MNMMTVLYSPAVGQRCSVHEEATQLQIISFSIPVHMLLKVDIHTSSVHHGELYINLDIQT